MKWCPHPSTGARLIAPLPFKKVPFLLALSCTIQFRPTGTKLARTLLTLGSATCRKLALLLHQKPRLKQDHLGAQAQAGGGLLDTLSKEASS